jgi:hypothetical protein
MGEEKVGAEDVEIDWRLNYRMMTSNSDENSHLHLTGSSSDESIPGADAPQSASPSHTQWMGMQWPLPTHWNCPGWQVSGAAFKTQIVRRSKIASHLIFH